MHVQKLGTWKMANNQSNQISGSSNAYNPNNLSLFPDLLQPVGQDVANQAPLPPAVLPELFGGENATRQPPRIVTVVAQGIYFDESNNELLVLEQGTGATPNQPLNNDQEGWMLPRPPSNIHPLGCLTIPGTTSNIHPAGRSTDSIPSRGIIRAERRGSIPTPRRIPITHPAGRTTSTPRPHMYPIRVPTRRRSAASSRAHVQNSDEPNIATREGSPVPGELQARGTISNCSICMNPFSDPTAAKCGHVFCRICINIAYELQGRCPMCRKSIDTRRDLLRIYLS
ncbi:hypothetical protein POM88_027937 [Heracleum sosnowskyi]|uniref:RING-type domain-containing protein n=1 Tax=Heracleum sosnowskyi TaxID=360622 RepID=A0AAD8IB58_9APIA|nr:hypothetical protein POM88_027937 [Heracleum sosnowskyi]